MTPPWIAKTAHRWVARTSRQRRAFTRNTLTPFHETSREKIVMTTLTKPILDKVAALIAADVLRDLKRKRREDRAWLKLREILEEES